MKLIKLFFRIAIIAVLVAVILNYQTVFDIVKGFLYQPSTEMVEIRDKLELTTRGRIVFNASQPTLNDEENFNRNCMSYDDDKAILGCYNNQQIYVYSINEKDLDGILELATAHELLHAVYGRMSDADKTNLKPLLEEVYKKNRGLLEKELSTYDEANRLEEIYVRAGTEIKNLPEDLEKHYTEIFKDQDKIVEYYNQYMKVFNQLEAEFKSLEEKMNELKQQIDSKNSEYESGTDALNAAIYQFNNCANRIDCFASNDEFNAKRNELLSIQDSLRALYDDIDSLVNQYNDYVEEYNSNVVRSNDLQNIINSHVKVNGL